MDLRQALQRTHVTVEWLLDEGLAGATVMVQSKRRLFVLGDFDVVFFLQKGRVFLEFAERSQWSIYDIFLADRKSLERGAAACITLRTLEHLLCYDSI